MITITETLGLLNEKPICVIHVYKDDEVIYSFVENQINSNAIKMFRLGLNAGKSGEQVIMDEFQKEM